ncbi:hypothetical protein [Bradyrhizobium sp.]|uniref:hypothetical protein n=1 Tax=Bradyrhizobium sp. TaxID=376 RepID=UPI0023A25D06|nr:hypothetical protein [Bradyrhizobium sp.]MDE1934203.1 hypothetical protein [Bradyrhizobium sp.]MDE2064238.1 hypothetical protein [Bradyrhizobium sp.]
MTEFDELRQLAAQTRHFINSSGDEALALRAIVHAHDVVLGIFPASDGLGLHVIKGDAILRQIADHGVHVDYSHTAIALQTREQAVTLQRLLN